MPKLPEIGVPQVKRWRDFSGGWVTAVSPELLNDQEAQLADNVSFAKRGSLSPMEGRTQRYAADFNVSPVTGLAGVHLSTGVSRLVFAAGTILYQDSPQDITQYTTQADWQAPGSFTWNALNLSGAAWEGLD